MGGTPANYSKIAVGYGITSVRVEFVSISLVFTCNNFDHPFP